MSEAGMVRVRLLPTSMVVRRAEPLEPEVQRSAQLRAVVSGPFENVRLAGRRLRPPPKIPLLPDLPWETSRSAYLPLSISGQPSANVEVAPDLLRVSSRPLK